MQSLFNKINQSKKGQVTVVILLIVAFALIFYAVTLNIGRVGQNKTATQIGAAQGASSLASAMASYGHQLLMQQLGGERKKCASSGLLGAIIGAIIAIVITIVSWGSAGPVAATLLVAGSVLAVANVVIQVTVIQPGITSAWNSIASDILPLVDQFMESAMRSAMSSSSNDPAQVPDLYDFDGDRVFGLDAVTSAPLDKVSRFGIYYQKIFDNVVINSIPAAETFQIELQDFVYQLPPWGPLPTTTDCGGGAICNPDSEECSLGVCETAWALWDPLPGYSVPGPSFPNPPPPVTFQFQKTLDPTHPCFINPANLPSVCNPCCLPEFSPDPRGPTFGQIAVRPGCCDCSTKPPTIDIPDPANPGNTITVPNPDYCGFNPALQCGTSGTCQLLSPYGSVEPTLSTFYAWVYDPYNENHENAFFSFREQLGKDDEHQLYFKDSINPNWAQQFAPPWNGTDFYVDDSTGYYLSLPFTGPPQVAENRIGVFPFLWKVSTWGFDLDDVITGSLPEPVDDPNDQRCKWCDQGRGVVCNSNLPYEMVQLNLTQNPTTLNYQTSYCVDTDIDDVTLDLTGSFELDQDICADPTGYGGGPFWKRGSDRFCSEGDAGGDVAWPYEGQCNKYYDGNCFFDPNRNGVADCPAECDAANNPIPALCECGDPSAANPLDVVASLFPEDILDDLIYEMTTFIEETNSLLRTSRAQISSTFPTWFNDWQAWIDPGPLAGTPSPTTGIVFGPCFPWDSDYDPLTPPVCQSTPGRIFIWHRNIEFIKDELIDLDNQSFQGAACGSPWCIPPRGCPGVTAFEEVTFDANGNGTDGDLEDVISCLNFNVEGYDYSCNGGVASLGCVNPPGTNRGNDWQYLQCMLTCSNANCNNLPRSVIPLATYDPSAYSATAPADEGDMAAMLQCVYNCNNATCSVMPATQASNGTPYPYAATIGTFDQFVDCTGFALNNTNNFRTLVRDALVQANPICDINPGGWLQLTGTAALEAQNQVDKFEMRRDFLQSRLTELRTFIATMIPASQEFSDFLTGPVADLVQARIDYDANPPDDFPFHVLYGWQDVIDPKFRLGTPGGESYWHIVKVEGRVPLRCDNACGLGGGSDPAWPKVRTYTEKAGFKRCYELVNTDGIVKFRVTRFDEAPDSTGSGIIFPNGQPLWRFSYAHPNADRGDVSAATLGTTCDSIMITDPAVPPETFKGAFLMNELIGAGPPAPPACIAACGGSGCPSCTGDCLADCGGDGTLGNNWDCWRRSHSILSKAGIASEVCAQYYYKGGVRPGLTFSFIDCPVAGF